jgi:hypothetical protein
MSAEEQAAADAARERKRTAGRQISKDEDRFAEEDGPTETERASADVLAARRILRVRRPEGYQPAAATGVFAGLSAVGPSVPPKPTLSTTGFGGVASSGPTLATSGFGGAPKSPSAPPINPFAVKKEAAAAHAAGTAAPVSFGSLNAKPDAAAVPSVFGAGSSFKFSFAAPPKAADATPAPAVAPSAQTVHLAPVEQVVDPHTETLFSETLKLYHLEAQPQQEGQPPAPKQWKDRGDVVVRVVLNKGGDAPWAAVVASAVKTHRSVLQALIGPSFRLGKRADRQITFGCIEAGQSAPETFSAKAPKDSDARIAALVEAINKADAIVRGESA